MNDFYTHITIVRRELYAEFVSCLKKHGVSALFGSLCNGTAQKKMLEYLGLEETEKVFIPVLYVLGLAAFLLYDKALEMFELTYYRKWQKKLKKLLKVR